MPKPISVTLAFSISGMPPNTRWLADNVTITVITGMVSAGTKSLLRRRAALALRASSDSTLGLPAVTPPKPAISAITITAAPTTAGGSLSPIRKISAYRIQKPPAVRRRGCSLSVTIMPPIISSTTPSSQNR